MTSEQISATEQLERTLEIVASGGPLVNSTERMRAALALAALQGKVGGPMRRALQNIINGAIG